MFFVPIYFAISLQLLYKSSNNRFSTNFALCIAYADVLSTFMFGLNYALMTATGDGEIFTK